MRIKTISVLSGKGGSGKSIISASLANFLAHCGNKVLLIDLDIFTRGLSFYLLSHKPYEAKIGIADYFRNNNKNSLWRDEIENKVFIDDMKPLLISEEYSKENLSFIPASSNLDAFFLDENLIDNERIEILNKLKTLFDIFNNSDYYDYIIIDTPGGNNFISNIVANLSDGYMLVSEADRTSWETIDLLLEGIKKTNEEFESIYKEKRTGNNLGFILNKNTLEPKEIITFLKRRFRSQELATIPLDIEAVRCYQNDEIPIIKDISFEFSKKIVELTKNLFSPVNNWSKDSLNAFNKIEDELSNKYERKIRIERKIKMTLQLSSMIPVFSSLIAITLGVIIITEKFNLSKSTIAMILFAIGYFAFVPAVFARLRKKE